jgi:hypothetical protein
MTVVSAWENRDLLNLAELTDVLKDDILICLVAISEVGNKHPASRLIPKDDQFLER